MSLVGPRPLILDEDQHVDDWATEAARPEAGHDRPVAGARPQRHPVRGDGQLDYLYVTNWSLSTDLKLIFRTFPALISPAGARVLGHT